MRLAERMGEDIVTFERQVTGHDLRPSGELRVTTNDTALIYLMTEVFAGFRRAYPEISLDVVVANQALNFSKRDADVAIRATERPPETLIGRRTPASHGRYSPRPRRRRRDSIRKATVAMPNGSASATTSRT